MIHEDIKKATERLLTNASIELDIHMVDLHTQTLTHKLFTKINY